MEIQVKNNPLFDIAHEFEANLLCNRIYTQRSQSFDFTFCISKQKFFKCVDTFFEKIDIEVCLSTDIELFLSSPVTPISIQPAYQLSKLPI